MTRVLVLVTSCPQTGCETREVYQQPADPQRWGVAAADVESVLCGCQRAHHWRWSDEDPHTYPTPVHVHSERPTPGVAA